MKNRLAVSLDGCIAADVRRGLCAIDHRAGRRATARATGGDVGGPIGAMVGGTVGAAVGAGLEIPNAVITSVQGERAPSVVVRERVVVGEPLPPDVELRPVPHYTRVSLCGRQRSPRDRRAAHAQGDQDHRLMIELASKQSSRARRPAGIFRSGRAVARQRDRDHPVDARRRRQGRCRRASASTTKSSSRACRPGAKKLQQLEHADQDDRRGRPSAVGCRG